MTEFFYSVVSLVPKLYLGTLLVLREIPFRAVRGIGNGVASAIAFPNGVWERGESGIVRDPSTTRGQAALLRMTELL
jgi:hypothetical protein